MSAFEYVSVLISIVLGLGITQIITGVAEMIHHWHRVRFYWPHLVWVFLAFFLHIQEWWLLFNLRATEIWRLPVFLFTLLYPITLFILARILFPSNWKAEVDLKVYYFGSYRKFFAVVTWLSLLSLLDNLFVQRLAIIDSVVPLLVLICSGFIASRKVTNERVHQLLALLLLALMLTSLAVKWNEWLLMP